MQQSQPISFPLVHFARSSMIKFPEEHGQNLSQMLNNYSTFVMIVRGSLARQMNQEQCKRFRMTLERQDGAPVVVKKYKTIKVKGEKKPIKTDIPLEACEWKNSYKYFPKEEILHVKRLAIHATNKNNDDSPFVINFWNENTCIFSAKDVVFSSHCNTVNSKDSGRQVLGRPAGSTKRKREDSDDDEDEECLVQKPKKARKTCRTSTPTMSSPNSPHAEHVQHDTTFVQPNQTMDWDASAIPSDLLELLQPDSIIAEPIANDVSLKVAAPVYVEPTPDMQNSIEHLFDEHREQYFTALNIEDELFSY